MRLNCERFNNQNQLEGIGFELAERSSDERPLQVWINASYGVGGSLRCRRVEVVEAASRVSGERDGTFEYAETLLADGA